MATGPRYRVPFRRRREGKTDYQLRRGLVLSRHHRLVVRGSLRNLAAQIIKAEVDGDKVIVSAHSGELAKNYGWLGDAGNVSAAYLTGLLCGLRAVSFGVKEVVFDLGLHYPSKGSRTFAALKGALDAGLIIPFDKEKLPDEKRTTGHHISEYAKRLSASPEAYQKQFSAQLTRGLKPEELDSHFAQVKEKVTSSLKKVEQSGTKNKGASTLEEFGESAEGQTTKEDE